MDPATGRRFVPRDQFLSQLYVHKMSVPAEDWREYARSDDFLRPLHRRLARLKIPDTIIQTADIAALDAGVRMLESIPISRGPESQRVLQTFLEAPATIPEHYWSVRPTTEPDQLQLRGAVLVRASEPNRDRQGALPRVPQVLRSWRLLPVAARFYCQK